MRTDLRSEIDACNRNAWENRYSDLVCSRESAEKALKRSMDADYPGGAAYARLNLAVCHFLRSENKQALKLCHMALEYFRDHITEKGYPATLTVMANIHESFGDYDSALENCQNAVRAAKEISYKEGIGEAKSVLGLIYNRLSDHSRALKAYREGLEIRRGLNDQKAIASSLNRIARTHTLMKQFDEALKYYYESLEIRESLDQGSVISWTYLGLGSTYEEMGEPDRARDYYEKILGEFKDRLDERCRLQAILGMGRVLKKQGRTEESLRHFNRSLNMAENLGAKPLIAESHQEIAYCLESIREFEKALHHYRIFRRIRQEILNDESRTRLKNRQIAFEIEKSEKEKEIFHLRNVELKAALEELSRKNRDITESIQYASRIQEALLHETKGLASVFEDTFILFLPKDVVSGDFYWTAKANGRVYVAAVDCTGHGVPGALMSMLGIVFLNMIILEKGGTEPGLILDELRNEVIRALGQSGQKDESKDGMDMSLCVYAPTTRKLEYAGAYNSIFLIRNGKLNEHRVDPLPIGYQDGAAQNFTTHSLPLQKGDIWYQFSDGFADQVGGPDNKRYKKGRLKEILLSVHREPMQKQKKLLREEFTKWTGARDQYDDVLVIGVKI